ncbi:Rrf2 family transcriptional regulator [Rhizobium sp. GR12]|uniref:Rrf2 family transcriptional regulator n=1 Tax=Rhizobium sp. GR12 TaxID=3053925 RepID=UPI002FBDDCCE
MSYGVLPMIGLKGAESLSMKSMATLYDLPKEYLSKTFQALSRAGIIAGSHGIFGGYRLCRTPDAVESQ